MSTHLDTLFESPLAQGHHDGAISIHDYSAKRRWGWRGKDAAETLRRQGWDLPDKPNRIVDSQNDTFVMALSQHEFWRLEPHHEAGSVTMGNDWDEGV